jgi:hypothetical protein
MKDIPPEVLIYIQMVKNFFNNNKEARDYFLSSYDEEIFFKYLSEISQKNFEKEGEVMLTELQFESLRKTISEINVVGKKDERVLLEYDKRIFIEFKDFGTICLN